MNLLNEFKRQKTCHNSATDDSDRYLDFDGKIVYHNRIDSADRVLRPLVAKLNDLSDPLNNKMVIGLDCEWDVRPRPSKVCLVQICLDSNDCHLFHLSAMNYKIPQSLESLISHKNCIKVGLNIKSDLYKLQRDYELGFDQIMAGDEQSVVDLSLMANQMLGKSERWSLSRLSEYLLKKPIRKELQVSNWSRSGLSRDQQRYAAIDAFASLQLYYEIKMRATPLGFS